MATQAERLATLEEKIQGLEQELDEEKEKVAALTESLTTTKAKIIHAEAWGKGVIWAFIAIAGFLSQFQTVAEWIRKL